jgi:hypothetical protein
MGSSEPSDAQVANARSPRATAPSVGIGQPDGRAGIQDQFTPIGEEALVPQRYPDAADHVHRPCSC